MSSTRDRVLFLLLFIMFTEDNHFLICLRSKRHSEHFVSK